ncbi:histidine--tRNA ligase [Spirochaeta isovalerica]|uniref:Histidine--tRNA ligase n=1 Tax=Spirochaeta isovalerica TaxID=150 RepID=A0A841RAF5_9SPIO|nr:histidine--tRNA ligase [Spirochaeta isovalerica]MBB6480227.1 histidyl-tRNA synthetase [Spirochaeta isovalerica]
MSNKIEPRILKGFRDFLPSKEIERKRIIGILEKNFESFGYVPIDTPVLEYTEVLLGKGGGETDKQVYRFEDNGGRDVSMRFDLTVPFARYMAKNRNDLHLPFKRYHINKVWRGENTQRGRYREFMQCDFDIVGIDTASADFEILMMMHDSMKAIDVNDITIHFSHRGIFNRLLDRLEILSSSVDILRIVDKLGKIGEEEVMALLKELTTESNAKEILDFIKPAGSDEESLAKMERAAGGTSDDTERLKTIFGYIKECGMEDSFKLDPSITRGLDYYTGIVYETFLDELPGIGSVCSGGRYNNLASLYTKEELPGVGAAIGLDRLLAALEELGRVSEKQSVTDLLILALDEKLYGHYHNLSRQFRKADINCEVFHTKKKLNAQFKYAEAKSIPFALICGEDEFSSRTVNIKDLDKRENWNGLTVDEAIAKLSENKR